MHGAYGLSSGDGIALGGSHRYQQTMRTMAVTIHVWKLPTTGTRISLMSF